MAGKQTPVMQQHAAAKRAHPDCVVFFRLGDFYEMFGDDAVLVSRELNLTLTSRNKGKSDEIPMAGVPHHAAHGYIGKLLERGYKVAICEQMADPSKVKGIVPREVVRIITPGLVTDGRELDAGVNNWLCAVDLDAAAVGIALLDLSTGELRAARVADLASVLGEIARAAPRELLLGAFSDEAWQPGAFGHAAEKSLTAVLGRGVLRRDQPVAEAESKQALGALAADAARHPPEARRALARVLRFARACHPAAELPVRAIGSWDPSETLVIDATAQSHLELVQAFSGDRRATLLGVIDETATPAGKRLLRRRLLAPLTDVARIRRRLDRVELFVVNPRLREELRGLLAQVGDLERLAMRASLGEATPRDLGQLRDGLGAAARVARLLHALDDVESRSVLGLSAELPDCVEDVGTELERALVERPPNQPKEGSVFRPGYSKALDELAQLMQNGAERMVELEARLRDGTGINNLKVRYTRVFGWYIEVSKSQTARVPEQFRRKQTVAAGERYTTPELDELADRIVSAEDRHRELELTLLGQLVELAAREKERVLAVSRRVARWDVAQALAEVAHRHDYCRPVVDDSDRLEIKDGRHPVVEQLAAAGRFVPNDVVLETGGERLWLVTGPNMAGKSTLLRQVALLAILAQLGGYVPASSARVGVVDRVLSRVGASDNLAGGESTFMVEMRETAEILRQATRRSLVILDEIGRGTSTFDGLAIAWAVAEHLDEVVGCRALFATHYHELTSFADQSPHAANHSVSARELNNDIVFLHRLTKGAASRSYGVAVAKLAGLPESVLARARALLEGFERGSSRESAPRPATRRASKSQLQLFAPAPEENAASNEVLATLRGVDENRMTPLEALELLARLKRKL